MKAKLKPFYQVQYRSGTNWLPLSVFESRAAAKQYAEQSTACRSGYQIVVVHRKGN